MNSIFVRIYGGILVALLIIGALTYAGVELVNDYRSQLYRERMARGTFYLMAEGYRERAGDEERQAWSRSLSRMFGAPVTLRDAGELAQAGKVGPKAVVAIAPWNGTPSRDGTRPADVVGSIQAPILMFCSPTDLVVPCTGPAFTVGVPATATHEAREAMPLLIGAGASIDKQAMMPIFDAAKNAVLLEAKDLTHFGLAHIESLGQERNELVAVISFAGAAAHEGDLLTRKRPYEQVPTAHYTVEFLLDVFSSGNSTASELGAVVAEADRDGRFVSVKEKLGGSSAAGGERGAHLGSEDRHGGGARERGRQRGR